MSDPDLRFAETVPVQLRPGRIRMIGSVREAAEVLLTAWPEGPETRKRHAAREACLRALQGTGTAAKARTALESVARDEGYLVTGIRAR